jgi:hypothetical protein
MADQSVIDGALVAHTAEHYDYISAKTGQRVVGDSLNLFVVESFESGVIEIKTRDRALFDAVVAGSGQGSHVRLLCSLDARRRGEGAILERTLMQVLPVEARKAG